MIVRWPGHIAAGKVENGIMSGLDFFPTLVGLAGDPNIKDALLHGKDLNGTTYKVHLDGYDQVQMLTGKGPSARHEVFYFAEGTLGAVRIGDWKFRMIDQPDGWIGGTVHVDWPILSNLRLDPFERMQFAKGNMGSFMYVPDFYMHEFWRFVFLQQTVGEYAQTFIDFPPMQRGASFNLEAVKAEIQERVNAMKGKME
jgi:arylsulfatase A-like enzyme